MWRFLFFLVFFTAGAATAVADEAPVDQNPDPKQAMVLDGYIPMRRIIAQAETLQGLVAIAGPTVAWNADMLWVKQGDRGSFAFTFGTAQWVRVGKGPAVWALLQAAEPDKAERGPDGVFTTEIQNVAVRDLAKEKDQGDHGSCSFARILLHDRGDDLYEIGIESEWLGTGHPVEERRLYVLHGPGGSWRFVGEGPSESSGKSGPTCSWSTTAARARLTGDPKAPVVLEFHITSSSAIASADAEPAYPILDIHREAILDGALTAKLRWASDPYVEIDKPGLMLDTVIKHYTYWEINDARAEFAKYNQNESAAFRRLVEDCNPALRAGDLAIGTLVHLPPREELLAHLRAKGR
jgi:hypothetical protein